VQLLLLQEGVTVAEAVTYMQDEGTTQPVLFTAEDRYWVKADHTPLPLLVSSCFADAVEFLIAIFLCSMSAIHIICAWYMASLKKFVQ